MYEPLVSIYKPEQLLLLGARISPELLLPAARSAHDFKAFPRLAHVHARPRQKPVSFRSLRHLYSRRPKETLLPCFPPSSPPQTLEEAITATRRGQIGWGSYLGRIMFDILHHYQLPPSPPQESYLSLADVPLSVMNFLCPPSPPPSSGPPYLSTPRLLLREGDEGGGGEARK